MYKRQHINIRGYYRNDYREKEVFVDVERQFLTNRMKWAGGMGVGRVFYSDDLPDRNVNRLEELFNYHYQDVWLGKSFLLPYRYSYNQNMFLTGRFFTTLFNNRPLVTDDTNHLYYNRRDYFAAFNYIKMKSVSYTHLQYLSCTVENALEPGDSHAVVADRNPGIDGRLQTVAQLGGCDHTASALNDQGIIRYRTFDPV